MPSRFPPALFDRIERCGVIAVLVIDRSEHGPPLAEALLAGGVEAMELTLRTPAALDALRAIRREAPGLLAGIGTILTPRAGRAGAGGGGGVRRGPGIEQAGGRARTRRSACRSRPA